MSGKVKLEVKLYKNPERTRPTNLKPYVPQYQLMGVAPEEYNSPTSATFRIEAATKPHMGSRNQQGVHPAKSGATPVVSDASTNPRMPRPVMRQPYAEAVQSPIGRGRGLLPNVGNNMEQTWSSVDGEIIDDLPADFAQEEQEMVDNNDFVSDAALGLSGQNPVEVLEVEEEPAKQAVPVEKTFLTENELQEALTEEYLSAVLKQLKEDEYLLLVDGHAVCSGDLQAVEDQTRALVFGEHPLCGGDPMPIEDIVVLKRAKLKVGLFLE